MLGDYNPHTFLGLVYIIISLSKLLGDYNHITRQTFKKILFSNDLHFDIKEKIFGADDLNLPFSVVNNKKEPNSDSNSRMVTRAGVEPTTFSLGRSCSIQLSYRAKSAFTQTVHFKERTAKGNYLCIIPQLHYFAQISYSDNSSSQNTQHSLSPTNTTSLSRIGRPQFKQNTVQLLHPISSQHTSLSHSSSCRPQFKHIFLITIIIL